MLHKWSLPRWLPIGGVALLLLHCGGNDDGKSAAAPQAAGAASGAAASGVQRTASASAGTAAASGDTWDSYAQGFFAEYCVSCHNDDQMGDAARDFHLRAAVDAESSEIACGLSKSTQDWSARGCTGFPPARQFPIGNGAKPSDADRDRLIAWIDAGRP